jgi:methyltransferase family protein
MYYLDFLGRLHESVAPAGYLEIGIRHGDSIALAQCPAIGIDPEFELRTEVPESAVLFQESSDEYFLRSDPLEPLGGAPVDLAFIDGMHLAEFALRDFANVERVARWTSVVVFDDILPADADMAARDRRTRAWTGDVYKLLRILRRYRPDLICVRIETRPTGLLLVLGLDPASRVLMHHYDRIVEDIVVPDPQAVPRDVLQRRDVLDPEAVLAAPLWETLGELRSAGTTRRSGLRRLRRAAKDLRSRPLQPASA